MSIGLILYVLVTLFINFLITTLMLVRYDIQVSKYIDKKIERIEEDSK